MKMKKKRKLLFALLTLMILLLVNGFYYVFHGQDLSARKLSQGKELNLYEKCSIYSMHVALWTLGWPLSPQAARECLMLHFPQKDTVSMKMALTSPRLEKAMHSLVDKPIGASVEVSWDGNKAYSLSNPEHKVAIAVNPCRIEKRIREGNSCGFDIYSTMLYPKRSNTVITIGAIRIPIQEGLFRYLQEEGWLSRFTAVYRQDYCVAPSNNVKTADIH